MSFFYKSIIILLIGNSCNTNHMAYPKKKDISMQIKTFDEYIKQTHFSIPVCQDDTEYEGVSYLKDGSKIEYQCCSRGFPIIREDIYTPSHPFIDIIKTYYCDSKKLASISYEVGGLSIKKDTSYYQDGTIEKVKDYDSQLGKFGYKNILKWAESQGFLDLKKVKILKGLTFNIAYLDFEDHSRQEVKEYYTKLHVKAELLDELISHEGYWTYHIVKKYHVRIFILSDSGVLVYDTGDQVIASEGAE